MKTNFFFQLSQISFRYLIEFFLQIFFYSRSDVFFFPVSVRLLALISCRGLSYKGEGHLQKETLFSQDAFRKRRYCEDCGLLLSIHNLDVIGCEQNNPICQGSFLFWSISVNNHNIPAMKYAILCSSTMPHFPPITLNASLFSFLFNFQILFIIKKQKITVNSTKQCKGERSRHRYRNTNVP